MPDLPFYRKIGDILAPFDPPSGPMAVLGVLALLVVLPFYIAEELRMKSEGRGESREKHNADDFDNFGAL